jgi:D-glycero-D-manno-heptose 1,7-bisphosphate phosphatase
MVGLPIANDPFMKSAIFLERDGILNLARVERGQQVSPRTLDDFHVNPAALAPLQELKAAGFLLLATTNQPGISRGYLSRRELDLMHIVLRKKLPLDDLLMCTHDEMDHCPCRKPKPGLIREAKFKYNLDLDRCFVVSEKWQDAEAAHNAGCISILLDSPWIGKGHRDFVLPDLNAIVQKILQLHASPLVVGQELAVRI